MKREKLGQSICPTQNEIWTPRWGYMSMNSMHPMKNNCWLPEQLTPYYSHDNKSNRKRSKKLHVPHPQHDWRLEAREKGVWSLRCSRTSEEIHRERRLRIFPFLHLKRGWEMGKWECSNPLESGDRNCLIFKTRTRPLLAKAGRVFFELFWKYLLTQLWNFW